MGRSRETLPVEPMCWRRVGWMPKRRRSKIQLERDRIDPDTSPEPGSNQLYPEAAPDGNTAWVQSQTAWHCWCSCKVDWPSAHSWPVRRSSWWGKHDCNASVPSKWWPASCHTVIPGKATDIHSSPWTTNGDESADTNRRQQGQSRRWTRGSATYICWNTDVARIVTWHPVSIMNYISVPLCPPSQKPGGTRANRNPQQ